MLAALARAWWKATTQPSTDTFRRSAAHQGHLKTLVGVLLAATVGVACSWLIHWLTHEPGERFMGLAAMYVKPGTPAPIGTWLLLVPLGVVYGFYSFEIVLFIFGRILGGRGSFGAQSYLQSLFYGPLAVVQQIVVALPGVGRMLFAVVAAASLVPTTTSLKAAHGYSTGRAVLTWVLPVILNVVIVATVVIVLLRTRG